MLTYPCLVPILYSPTRDSNAIEEPIEVTPHPMMSDQPCFPPTLRKKAAKRRKVVEEYKPGMKAMDLDNFEFDEVILRDIVVLDALITYFNECTFGRIDLKKRLVSSFWH